MAALTQWLGTGRRKRGVARVFLRNGSGAIVINGRPYDQYFTNESSRLLCRQALQATETSDKFDVLVLANGGGMTGQAGAVRLGISRAHQLQRGTPRQVEEHGLPDARSSRTRAQEIRAEGRPQAVPVLQALIRAWMGSVSINPDIPHIFAGRTNLVWMVLPVRV